MDWIAGSTLNQLRQVGIERVARSTITLGPRLRGGSFPLRSSGLVNIAWRLTGGASCELLKNGPDGKWRTYRKPVEAKGNPVLEHSHPR